MAPNPAVLLVTQSESLGTRVDLILGRIGLGSPMRVGSVEEARQQYGAGKVGLVLLDQTLGASGDLETLDRLIVEVDDPPVVVLLPPENRRLLAEAQNRGAQAVLLTDWLEPELVRSTLARARGRHRVARELLHQLAEIKQCAQDIWEAAVNLPVYRSIAQKCVTNLEAVRDRFAREFAGIGLQEASRPAVPPAPSTGASVFIGWVEKHGRRPRVLVIDDSEMTLAVVRRRLDAVGIEVITTTQPSCQELISRVDPDLVLVDVMMPGMKGDAVVETLRQVRGLRGTVVLHSDLPEIALMEITDRCGAVGYVSKLQPPDQFIEAIKAWLESGPQGQAPG